MKKSASNKHRNLDKGLVEAGLVCKKRFHLELTAPAAVELSTTRQAMADVGKQLVEIAQSVFPKGAAVTTKTPEKAAAETQKLLAAEAPVLFGATFIADDIVTVSDIMVRHKDGAIDLYEVKSGTKVKQRYLADLALQAHVLAASGHTLRAAFLLNLNPKYAHKEGADFPPMQLLRSTEVTTKVQKQLPHLQARLSELSAARDDESVLELPMGTYCLLPLRCPHYDTCSKATASKGSDATPAYELPELTREQEVSLRRDRIYTIADVDPDRPGLTSAQRQTIECVRSGKTIIEDFVAEELRQCRFPLHFVATATITDALPRFDGQRPWRRIPYAWSAHTLYEDGRLETATFAHSERGDPRLEFATSLGEHVGNGGTVLCWNAESIDHLRALLEDLPAAKVPVRAVIGRAMVDLMQLFEAGVFHPELRSHDDLRATVKALLDDSSGDSLPVGDEDQLRKVLQQAWTPRVRATTRDKIAAQITASLSWRSERLLALFGMLSGVDVNQRPAPAAKKPSAARALPKLPRE